MLNSRFSQRSIDSFHHILMEGNSAVKRSVSIRSRRFAFVINPADDQIFPPPRISLNAKHEYALIAHSVDQ